MSGRYDSLTRRNGCLIFRFASVVDGGVKRIVWTSDAPNDEAQGIYRVKVEYNCQQ